MATNRHHLNPRGLARMLCLFVLTASAAGGAGFVGANAVLGTEGTVARVKPSSLPSVDAAFPRESYAAGETARLTILDHATGVRVQVFRAGTESVRLASRDVMLGTPVGRVTRVGSVAGRRAVSVPIGPWETGFYYARLTADGDRIGYAPFVVRPKRNGENRVALVLPTYTWQTYNFRDDDGDRKPDTWYGDKANQTVLLGRPYSDHRGVPPHYKNYDQPFLRWLHATGRSVDYLAQSDVERLSGKRLRSAYDLIIFPGHHEYVTTREYDVVESYRDRGGNLMFLSANNFFWRVIKRGNTITKTQQWRDLGRPEAALIGVQYIKNDDGRLRGPWLVKPSAAHSWVFDGIKLIRGREFSNGGIEIDKMQPSSPPGTKLLAEIPNVMGPGMSAHMTYYETKAGAKVFAAGAFTLAGAIRQPHVQRLIENLWARMAVDELPR